LTLTFSGSIPSSLSTATGLDRERFVQLEEIDSSERPAGLFRDAAHGLDGRHQDEFRRQAAGRLRHDARERRQAERLGAFGSHHDERRRAVVDAGRVAGGDRAVLLERGLERGERLGRRVGRAYGESRSTDEPARSVPRGTQDPSSRLRRSTRRPTRRPRRSPRSARVQEDGTVTAGNAPGVNDGASALV